MRTAPDSIEIKRGDKVEIARFVRIHYASNKLEYQIAPDDYVLVSSVAANDHIATREPIVINE